MRNEVVPGILYTYSDDKQPGYTINVNGSPASGSLDKGYFAISRQWKKGDIVTIHFDMEPRTVKAHPDVLADNGRVAVERGPVVYCAEWPDNDFSVLSVFMNRKPAFTVEDKPDLLYGIHQIKTEAQTLSYDEKGRLQTKDVTLSLIPYYAWAHRGKGEMSVWLPQEVNAARPTPQKTASAD